MIEEGDVVCLRSASKSCEADFKSSFICVAPKMTVSKITIGGVHCVWWDGNEYRKEEFNSSVLTIVYKNNEFSK